MLVLAGLHLGCGAFLAWLMARAPAARAAGRVDPRTPRPAPHRSALLQTLGAIVLLGSLGAALLDYVFKFYATAGLGRGSELLRFFALFYAAVAVSSFILQAVAAKPILEKFGLGKTIRSLPATLAGGSFLTLVAPGLILAVLARAAEAAVRGSLFRAGYETAYTPVPPDEKRLAKTFIDVVSERGGDALGGAVVYLCVHLAGQLAPFWILGIAALVGLGAVILCGALDGVYLETLARSLESQAVKLNLGSDLDLTTRSLVMRAPTMRAGATELWKAPAVSAAGEDSLLQRLAALRSSDPRIVHSALRAGDVSDPVLAAQVCLLLCHDHHAALAYTVLARSAKNVLGVLSDLMLDSSQDVAVRRRIPRIIASVPGKSATEALLEGLEDGRFEVRLHCARALAKAPRPAATADRIVAAVDRELEIGATLWQNHRNQQRESGTEWLDDLLRDKAHGSLEYVFTLLSLIHERAPLMAAFRSLHLEDRRLRGTALEYLEGILPAKTREMLWGILQERPLSSRSRDNGEIMQDLLKSSETILLRLRQQQVPEAGRH
jgi:hypothetical protein